MDVREDRGRCHFTPNADQKRLCLLFGNPHGGIFVLKSSQWVVDGLTYGFVKYPKFKVFVPRGTIDLTLPGRQIFRSDRDGKFCCDHSWGCSILLVFAGWNSAD